MYGVITKIPASVEMYDRMHAELVKQADSFLANAGLLVHVARAAPDGFEVYEVWESQAHYDRATEAIASLMGELAGDLPQPSGEPSTEVFEVRGIVIPRGYMVV